MEGGLGLDSHADLRFTIYEPRAIPEGCYEGIGSGSHEEPLHESSQLVQCWVSWKVGVQGRMEWRLANIVNPNRFGNSGSRRRRQAAAGANATANFGRLSARVALLALVLPAAGSPRFTAEVCQRLTDYGPSVWRQFQRWPEVPEAAFTACLRGNSGVDTVWPRCVSEVDIGILNVYRPSVAINVLIRRLWLQGAVGLVAAVRCVTPSGSTGLL